MKNTFTRISGLALVLAGLGVSQPAWAQAPAWQSAIAAGQTGDTFFTAVTPDANGNVYVTGYFEGTITLGGTSLTSAGGTDVFVAKYQVSSNTFAWAQRAGSLDNDYSTAIASSGANVYVAGNFGGATSSFGPIVLASAGQSDGFLVKLTDAGITSTFSWAQRLGGTAIDAVSAIAVAGNSLYVAGSFASPTLSLGTTTLTTAGQADIFVTKLTDAGAASSFNWAQRAGGTDSDYPSALTISGNNLYVAGSFQSPSFVWGNTTLPNVGDFNGYIAKLTDTGASGNPGWAQGVGGSNRIEILALAANGANVYAAGNFSGTNTALGTITLTSAGYSDAYVAKLVDAGAASSFAWAQRAGGADYDVARALAVSGTGIYVSGFFFSSTADFGATTLTSAGQADIFVSRLTDAGTTGSFSWAQRAGGTSYDNSQGLALSGSSVVTVGNFQNQAATFGTVTIPMASVVTGYIATLRDRLLGTTSVAEQAILTLYPNPAHHAALVRVAASSKLNLLDGLGRVVRTAVAPAGATYTLDLAGLAPSIYALQARVGEKQSVQRLVVE